MVLLAVIAMCVTLVAIDCGLPIFLALVLVAYCARAKATQPSAKCPFPDLQLRLWPE
ncbi:hypothetical protein J4558_04150 [Leptolyngbya sp. 15MV]|nr:hypothetical protein J4558_04150 [Leptolyngbya sp. 15MV]